MGALPSNQRAEQTPFVSVVYGTSAVETRPIRQSTTLRVIDLGRGILVRTAHWRTAARSNSNHSDRGPCCLGDSFGRKAMRAMGNVTRQMHQRGVIVAAVGAILGTLSLASLSDASMRATSAIALKRGPPLVVTPYDAINGVAFCAASPTRMGSPRSAVAPDCDVASR